MATRKKIPEGVKLAVLTEAGYRCAVPTCRGILALDLHHIVPVAEGGGDEVGNLVALCPTCHALHHRGNIPAESLAVYKGVLVSLSRAFDMDAVDKLLLLSQPGTNSLLVSGDGVIHFARLIVAGLVLVRTTPRGALDVMYWVTLTDAGKHLIEAWKSGDREALGAVRGLEVTA